MGNLLIRNCTILTMNEKDEPLLKGSIGVSGSRIAFVGGGARRERDFLRDCGTDMREIDGSGHIAMPGLVNTHNHISMSLLRSYADDYDLMTWLNGYIWPFEEKLQPGDIRAGAELGIAEMLLGGITTTADMYWMEEEVGKAVENMGIRAVLSPTFTDARFADFERDFAAVRERYMENRHPRITVMVAPHAAYSCSRANLEKAGELAGRYGLGLQIHVSETMDEQKIVREKYGCTPVEFLDSLGLMRPSTLAVHAVHIGDGDIGIMRERGVSVSHNPQSNMKLASGTAPVLRLMEAGVNVALGTDGPSSNNDLDIWEEMRSASFLQKLASGNPCALPAREMLEMVTVNGAEALGLGDRIGRLEEGMLADIILLDTERPHMYPKNNLTGNLVYCAKGGDVRTVIVDGNIVVENGTLVTADVAEICRKAQFCVDRIIS